MHRPWGHSQRVYRCNVHTCTAAQGPFQLVRWFAKDIRGNSLESLPMRGSIPSSKKHKGITSAELQSIRGIAQDSVESSPRSTKAVRRPPEVALSLLGVVVSVVGDQAYGDV